MAGISIEDRLAIEELVGEYEAEYIRTPGGWCFRRRRLVPIDQG